MVVWRISSGRFHNVPYRSPSSPLSAHQDCHVLSPFPLIMMLHLSSSSAIRNRPRSNSHPVRPQRDGRLPEAEESFLPLRPARNPSRPTTFGEGQLVPPSPFPGPKLTRAPEDNDDCWEGGREIGPEERYRQSVNVVRPFSLMVGFKLLSNNR